MRFDDRQRNPRRTSAPEESHHAYRERSGFSGEAFQRISTFEPSLSVLHRRLRCRATTARMPDGWRIKQPSGAEIIILAKKDAEFEAIGVADVEEIGSAPSFRPLVPATLETVAESLCEPSSPAARCDRARFARAGAELCA